MSELESQIVLLLKDPDYFRAAVTFTAQRTAFTPRLVEKDYLCTVLLEYLAAAGSRLVFKGGTCLSKVHAGFYRLSEDFGFYDSDAHRFNTRGKEQTGCGDKGSRR